jgi:4-diphosphocytidyl-2-C-methyl-D-erythritol kinase
VSAARRAPRRLRIPSYAKINLGLEVLGLRDDGYHELRTLFQTIDLHDQIELRAQDAGVTLDCDHPGLPRDESNLAVRAALELQRFAERAEGVAITLRKRIPVAGGLGGGSSNAAAVLLGLDCLWGLGLGPPGLQALARRLGADVPFFLMGGTALGLARGDEVYPLRNQVRAHWVLVDPERPISTAAVFRRVDACLTPRQNSHTIIRFVSSDLEGIDSFSLLSNDLEAAALEEAPDLLETLGRIRGILVKEGASLAALSGSGSSFFGLFNEARSARRAQAALSAGGFRAYRGRTLTLGEYRMALSRSLGRGGRGQGRIR